VAEEDAFRSVLAEKEEAEEERRNLIEGFDKIRNKISSRM